MSPERVTAFFSSRNPMFENGSGKLFLEEFFGDGCAIDPVTEPEEARIILLDEPTPEEVAALKPLYDKDRRKAIWVLTDGEVSTEELHQAGATAIFLKREEQEDTI